MWQHRRHDLAGIGFGFRDHQGRSTTQGNEKHITGTIPATLADFKIDPPSLLTIPVKNEIPVRVHLTWSPQ
jgi:hypothetical protein